MRLLRFFRRGREERGPFKADRILNESETKVDEVFTSEGRDPVALVIHTTEGEAKKIRGGGWIGPTDVGAKGEYERDKSWVTRAFYWPDKIPGGQFNATISGQIADAESTAGIKIPSNLCFERIEGLMTIPVSGKATVTADPSGTYQVTRSARAMEEQRSEFVFSVKTEIRTIFNTLTQDVMCRELLPTEAWQSKSTQLRPILINHQTDYEEISEFYARIEVRNCDIGFGDQNLIRRHNEETLRLAKTALGDIVWKKYSA